MFILFMISCIILQVVLGSALSLHFAAWLIALPYCFTVYIYTILYIRIIIFSLQALILYE
ncbi:hypothetical protein HMPREF1981_02491 [Bacteroides pyogenes F0041]|uniref:Uncharacterized protein n=1 Tax=Bacteroides pyogenes F0041 TaxID=1321819 RepID=U2DRH0_9BACE|nr:hypothetical protein HMPREF1981_02491 [Bacteroides pyogenes F0041]